IFDEESFRPLGEEQPRDGGSPYPPELRTPQSNFPGMRVSWKKDSGETADDSSFYALRWETRGRNRDRPRDGPLPENSELVLYKIGSE
ncbi:MAG: hypothetical protein ACPGSB_10645, partial [Opitutales bacterium]